MHFSSDIAELLREWAQLRAEMERLHCQFKASHDHSVEAGLRSIKTRAGSLLHQLKIQLETKNSPPSKPKPQKLQRFLVWNPKRQPAHYTGRASGKKSPYEKGMLPNFFDRVVIDLADSAEWPPEEGAWEV
jgi:hypothetical protein